MVWATFHLPGPWFRKSCLLALTPSSKLALLQERVTHISMNDALEFGTAWVFCFHSPHVYSIIQSYMIMVPQGSDRAEISFSCSWFSLMLVCYVKKKFHGSHSRCSFFFKDLHHLILLNSHNACWTGKVLSCIHHRG